MMSRGDELKNKFQEFKEYLENNPGNEIPQVLEEIEELILSIISDRPYLQQKHQENRDRVECKIIAKITGNSVNITDLLDELGKRVSEILKKSPEEIDRELRIFVQELEGVILPPGKGNSQEGIGNTESKEEKELSESRYGKMLEILRENEIYADDIIVYTAGLNSNQMRQASYRVIQIPRISKTIFVCDEYGEASFIVDSLVYPEVFLESTKSHIREKLDAEKIVHRDGWEERFIDYIFGEKEGEGVEKKKTVKIDVRKMEEYRQEILRQFPTPEDWMNLTAIKKKRLKFFDKGIKAVSRVFGVVGNPIGSSKIMSDLGRKIYGEGFSVLESKRWGKKKWISEIKKRFPTIESWMNTDYKERLDIKFYGIGLHGISTLLGVSTDPRGNDGMIELGEIIFGKSDLFDIYRDSTEIQDWDKDRWRNMIISEFPSPESWMRIKTRDRRKVKFYGKGLSAIATIFGVDGNPNTHYSSMAKLGQEIYGDSQIFIDSLKDDITSGWSIERWKEEILGNIPDFQTWIGFKQREKLRIKIGGKGLRAISTIFGIEGNPITRQEIMKELGKKIYN